MSGAAPASDHPRLAGLALLATVAACVALRLAALPSLETPEHDDAVTYIEATCHQGEFNAIVHTAAPPFAHWSTAGDWQRLWSVEDRYCFPRIARELGSGDIHPPLYFWLLHPWLIAFGVNVLSGPALNVLLAAGTVVLVHRLGRQVSGHPAATVGALVWALSPAALSITLVARQYELLALLAVAFTWQVLRLSEPGEALPGGWAVPGKPRPGRSTAPWEPILFALTGAAGLLTHYHFLLLVAAAGAVGIWRLRRSDARRRIVLIASIGAAVVMLAVAHPYLFDSLARSPNRVMDFGAVAIARRAARTIKAVANFGGVGMVRPLWALAVAAAAASILARARRRAGAPEAEQPAGALTSLLAMVVLLWAAIALLYVASVSPSHAMRPRYLAMVWPLLAVAVTGLLWRHRWGRWLAGALCVGLLAASASWLGGLEDVGDAGLLSAPHESLLVDTVARGILPRVLWHLPPQTRVYAASQLDLLDRPGWLDASGDRGLYVSSTRFGNHERARRQVLELLRTRFEVTPGPRHSTVSESFRLRRLEGGEPRLRRSVR